MRLPKPIVLYYAPAQTTVEAGIVELTANLIQRRMGEAWWSDSEIDPALAEREIDRHWNWQELEIERDPATILPSQNLAIVTGDGAVQGAGMYSTQGVPSVYERGKRAIFVELLFTAPRNRRWLRLDKTEQFRGVGVELLIAMAQASRHLGFEGRLKLESSPLFVDWYEKRGLQKTPEQPIIYQGVEYTPMELTASAAILLLAEE